MEPLGQVPGQHVGWNHHWPATSGCELLALPLELRRAIYGRLSIPRECSRRWLRPWLSVHGSLLEDGVLKALGLSGILSLQLPCLALCGTLCSVGSLGWAVDVLLNKLARRLRGGQELAALLGRRHSGSRCCSLLGRRAGLLRFFLTGGASGVVISGREFFGGQAERRPKSGSAADGRQAYERRGPLDAIGAGLLLLL
jgi:hypothetical protein